MHWRGKKKRVLWIVGAVLLLLLLAILVWWGRQSYREHVRLMENIKLVTANPGGLKPGAIIDQIDRGFARLPATERQKILADPKLLSERIEKASYENYKQAFGQLFLLPAPLREKVIASSAASIAASIEKNRQKVDNFYDSDAGKAALRAASNYFLLELSGRQKAELKPITDAFFKVHQNRMQRGKN